MGDMVWAPQIGPLATGGAWVPSTVADVPPAEQKAYSWTQMDQGAALTVRTLVHGPGATELLHGWRGNDANSAVFACLQAICSAYVEAPLTVYQQTSPKDREPMFDSPLQKLLDYPNPALDILEILWWVQWAKHVDGNAYLRKLRSGNEETGNVVELWPISPTRIEPRTIRDSGEFISYYRYHLRPGHHEDISPANIIHFRMGVDDRDMRLGCAPLKRLAREVSSDDAATRFADALLRNYAVPGLVVQMPGGDNPVKLTEEEAAEIKAKVAAAYGGENAGRVGVLTAGATMQQLGFSPEQLDMKALHQLPEERISAVLRVPAIVAGLGAGLARSTFANFSEAREAFIENTILSLYRSDDKKLTHSLAPDFTSDGKVSIVHDISQMRALQDDEDKKATRLAAYVAAEIMTVDEARGQLGLEPLPERPAAALPSSPEARGRPRIVELPSVRGRAIAAGLLAEDRDDTLTEDPAEIGRHGAASSMYGHQRVASVDAARSPDVGEGVPDTAAIAGRHQGSGNHGSRIPRFTKAPDDLPARFEGLRADRESDWQGQMERYLEAQHKRVNAALRAGTTSADGLVADSEGTILGQTLRPLQAALLADVHALVLAELGIEFELDDPHTRAYLRQAGANIRGITDYTRDRVRAALAEGQAAGEGIPELARRLRDLPAFGQARAQVVARTELGTSQNLAARTAYIASGVVTAIRVLDSDADPLCQAWNGRVVAMDMAGSIPMLGHPNCVRALAPVVGAQEATG